MLEMSILMSVSKSTQVLCKFYVRDTPQQDQRAWEQKGLSGPVSMIRPGLLCGQGGGGGDFSRGQLPQDNSVVSGAVWVTGLFSLCPDEVICIELNKTKSLLCACL